MKNLYKVSSFKGRVPSVLRDTWHLTLLLVLLAAPAFGASWGFDFRATAPFVADPANTTYVGATGAGAGEPYPVTRNGIAFGYTVQPGNTRDRDSGLDPRLAGIHFSDSATVVRFRVDLPAPGTYTIDLALGDPGGGATQVQSTIYDNTTALAVIGPLSPSTGQFVDATGAIRTSAADWVTNHQTTSLTFTTSTFFITLDRNLASIAHLTIASGPPDTIAPSDPTNVLATVLSADQISLGWTPSTDDIATPSYRIESCIGAGCSDFVQVGTSATPDFLHSGLTASSLYRYRVIASDGTNDSQYSAVAQGLTLANRQATVTWADPTNTDHTGYIVQRATGVTGTYANLATVSVGVFTYVDTNSPTPIACYRVRAIRSGEDGPNSSSACTTESTAPAAGTHLYGALLTGKIQIVP